VLRCSQPPCLYSVPVLKECDNGIVVVMVEDEVGRECLRADGHGLETDTDRRKTQQENARAHMYNSYLETDVDRQKTIHM
jgi:hypothetical protein